MPEFEGIRKVKARRVVFDGEIIQPVPMAPPLGEVPPGGPFDLAAFGEGIGANPQKKAPEPPVKIDLTGATLRGEATPSYFIKYDTEEEYNLRLRHTFISYKGSPVYIQHIYGSKERFIIRVETCNGEIQDINHEDIREIDTRSFAPGYISTRHILGYLGAAYLYRKPARVYRQGMNNENSVVKLETNNEFVGIGDFNRMAFMKSFEPRKIKVPLSEKILKELNDGGSQYHNASQMLSTNFAMVKDRNTKEIQIKFRGMIIGNVIKDNTVITNIRIPKLFGAEMKELNLL